MLKIYADFNSRNLDGACFTLRYHNEELETQAHALNIVDGDRVLIYKAYDDFEVEAVLRFEQVQELGKSSWVAHPDWSTIIRK